MEISERGKAMKSFPKIYTQQVSQHSRKTGHVWVVKNRQ